MAVRLKEQADGHPANVNLEPKNIVSLCKFVCSSVQITQMGFKKTVEEQVNSDSTDHCTMH